jgi:hypothetical protein
MSDDNVVDFGAVKAEDKSNNADTVEKRVINCMENGKDCKCKYCTYKEGAASMVTEFIASDMMQFENNTHSRMCTFDIKDILYKAILKIKEMEKGFESEEEQQD